MAARILAIDPGISGAYAFLDHDGGFISAGELPRFAKMLDGISLTSLVKTRQPKQIVIEKVNSMPGQGVSSTFTFGTAYGVCIGVACSFNVPIAYITPTKWKTHFRLTGKDKDASRELAIRLYPDAAELLTLHKHHGRADAILLARYAFDMDNGAMFT